VTPVTRPVRYGEGAVRQVPELVAGFGARRVLLVCGRRSFEASGAARILPGLLQVAAVCRWSDFAANPDASDLVSGLTLAEDFRPDLVLGVGGGSALDLAKLLCAFAGIPDAAKLAAAIRAGDRITGRDTRLVLVPTTSGSGSEATHFAVVYLGEEKFSVAGDPLRPDLAVLDPALSLSGSAHQRASSGIDAVAQAIESLWAVGATGRSRRWAGHALGLLLPAIESYVHQPTAPAARAMAIGSHLAGRAIDISRTTAAHALSYGITKRYGVSHGHAVALTLGGFLEVHTGPPPGSLRPGVDPATHREVMAEILGRLGAAGGADARARFQALVGRLGLAARLPEVGITTVESWRELVRMVNAERLGNNPVRFDQAGLAAIAGWAD
jgi:alcohol dehydrogenase class IV